MNRIPEWNDLVIKSEGKYYFFHTTKGHITVNK